MTVDTGTKARRIIADVFNLKPDEISAKSSPDTIRNWDSLQYLNLVLALEQGFGLRFSPEEIEKMENVGAIEQLIQTKLAREDG